MLTKLQEYKLRQYQQWWPKIQSAEQALEVAIGFETLYKQGRATEEVIQDMQELFNMALLLEASVQG